MTTYSTKYTMDFCSLQGAEYSLLLRNKNYVGAVYPLKGGKNPITLKTPQRKRKFTPIAGTEMKMTLAHNPAESAYNILDDFKDVTDRQWLAELRQKVDGEAFEARGKIDALNLTSTSTPASAIVDFNALASYATSVTCLHSFEQTPFNPPEIGDPNGVFSLWAKPANSSSYNPTTWILIAQATATPTTTTSQLIDLFALDNIYVQNTGANDLDYTGPSYEGKLDATYQLVVTVDRTDYYQLTAQTTNYRFSVVTTPFISLVWNTRQISSSAADSVVIATYNPITGDTLQSAAENIRDQINGTQGYFLIDSVLMDDDSVINIKIQASVDTTVGVKLVLKLLDIGTQGNTIEILSTDINDTYLKIFTDPNSLYDITFPSAFTGGVDGGDNFAFNSTIGNVHVTAQVGDTIDTLLGRLIDGINVTWADAEAIINPSDTSEFIVTIYRDMVGETYSFSTTGGSTLSDDGPSWLAVESTVVKWTGFVIPGLNKQSHLPGATFLQLSAVCGLGDLKNYTFTFNNKRPFEKLALITLISQALSRTGLALKIYESFDLYEISMDKTVPAIEQVYEDAIRLNGISSYKVLEGILPVLGAYIMQVNGHWELRPISQLKNPSITFRVFSAKGSFISEKTITDYIVPVGCDNVTKFVGAGATKRKVAPFRKLITEQDFGFVPQLVRFPNFTNINENLTQATYNSQYPWRWVYGNASYASDLDKINLEDDGYLRILDSTGQSIEYQLTQKLPLGKLEQVYDPSEREFKLELAYEIQEAANVLASTTIQVMVKFTLGTSVYYLYEEDPDIPVANPITLTPTVITLDATGDKRSKTTFIQSFNFPYSGETLCDVEVFLLQPTAGYVRIKAAAIVINSQLAGSENIAEYFVDEDSDGIKWNDRVTSEVETVPIELGDVPDFPAAFQMFKNALFLFSLGNEVTTQVWTEDHTAPTPVYNPLVSIIRSRWMNEYAVPADDLQGSTLGKLQLHSILQDASEGNTLYLLKGGSFNLRMDTVQGEWEQINLSADAPTFPTERVIEQLQTEEESSGTNSYTGESGSGGRSLPAGAIEWGILGGSIQNQTDLWTWISLFNSMFELDDSGATPFIQAKYSLASVGELTAYAAGYIPPSIWDSMPIASATVLGGIKVGANLSIDASGVLSATGGGTGAVWGAITGVLADQLDLNTALLARPQRTENDTISGQWNFLQNIGVGTSGPLAPLSVYNITNNPQLIIEGNNSSTVNRLGIKVYNNQITFGSVTSLGAIYRTGFTINVLTGAVSFPAGIGVANGSFIFWQSTGNARVGASSANNMELFGYTSTLISTHWNSAKLTSTGWHWYNDQAATGAEIMTLLDSGFLGINNTAPAYQLDVVGSGKFSISLLTSNVLSAAGDEYLTYGSLAEVKIGDIAGVNFGHYIEIPASAAGPYFWQDGGTQRLMYHSGNSNLSTVDWRANRFIGYNQTNNGTPTLGSTHFDAYGIIANRGSMYISNAGGDIKFGPNSSVHSANTKMVLDSNGLSVNSSASPTEALDVTGNIILTGNIKRTAHNNGFLEGSYNNVGPNSANTNPIYTIGSSYNPTTTTLSNMYGIGFANGGSASFLSSFGGSWGMYLSSAGVAKVFLDGGGGHVKCTGNIKAEGTISVLNAADEGVIIGARGSTTNTGGYVLFLENISGPYGFALDYEGETSNIFKLKRYNGSTTASTVFAVNRVSNHITFYGNVIGSGDVFTGTTGALCCRQTTGTDTTTGLSLYGSSSNAHQYGIQFMNTSTSGYASHGSVTDVLAMFFNMSNSSGRGWIFRNSGGSSVCSIEATTGNLVSSGEITAYSDSRLKFDKKVISDPLSKLTRLAGYTYLKDSKRSAGLIAQEVYKVLPEAVHGQETADSYLSLNDAAITALLVEGINEHTRKIVSHEVRIRQLEREVADLKHKN